MVEPPRNSFVIDPEHVAGTRPTGKHRGKQASTQTSGSWVTTAERQKIFPFFKDFIISPDLRLEGDRSPWAPLQTVRINGAPTTFSEAQIDALALNETASAGYPPTPA